MKKEREKSASGNGVASKKGVVQEETINWGDAQGNEVDPRAGVRRFGRIAFCVCMVLMSLLYFWDDLGGVARVSVQKMRDAKGWAFVRMCVHFMLLIKFLGSRVRLVKRNTLGYILLIGFILTSWDGLSFLAAAVVTILLCLTKIVNEEISERTFKHKKELTPARLRSNRFFFCVLFVILVGMFVTSGAALGEELQFFIENAQSIIRYGPNFRAHLNKTAVETVTADVVSKVAETGVHILAVGAGQGDATALQVALEAAGHTVAAASSVQEANDLAGEYTFNAMVISAQLNEDQAHEIQEELRKQSSSIPVVIRARSDDAAARTAHLTSRRNKKHDSTSSTQEL